MPIPADVSTANIDSETDDPRLWRADGLDLTQKFNTLLAFLRNPTNAAGDGVTNDTAAFTALEAEFSGRVIDLLGKTYLVDAVPTGNVYVNGSFLVGSDAKAQGSDELVSWLTYHKARGAWHIGAFGNSRSAVGSGNAAVDTAALQAAMASGEIIDITGAQLRVNDTIVCDLESSKIGATIQSNRNAGAASQILIDDDELPIVFKVGHDNFEASGFSIRGNSTNETTTMFWFERTVDDYRDIDARILNMSLNFGARAVYHKGRGLEFAGNTISDFHIAGIELDQPDTWTPRGSASIDGPQTGTRGIRLLQNRVHAMPAPFLLNEGPHALDIQGIEINGVMADIGADGGLIKGVMIDLQATDIQCRYSAFPGSRIFELQPGSRNVTLTNFNCAGFIGGSGNRLSNHGIRMTSSATNPIRDIFIIGGTIGPTLQGGVVLQGDGAYDNICFTNVVWQGIGQAGAYSPIQISSAVTTATIKLVGTHARDNAASMPFLTALNTPSDVTMIREVSATKDATLPFWATAGVVQPT